MQRLGQDRVFNIASMVMGYETVEMSSSSSSKRKEV
jgi:hypothetical protein